MIYVYYQYILYKANYFKKLFKHKTTKHHIQILKEIKKHKCNIYIIFRWENTNKLLLNGF